MKFKLRFEPKDMLIFAGVLLLIFLLIAVAISNIVYFGETGKLYGFNPFLALFHGYLLETFVFFGIAVLVLLTSSKSYFFEFDKGFGFLASKKSEGYSRWANNGEMKKELTPVKATALKTDAGGIVLMNDGKTLWVDNGDYHNLVIGSTGSGKTQCVIFPMVHTLAKHNESMIITDPKGEIYEKTSEMLRRKGYKIVLLNFRSPGQGNAWNPLTLPYKLWKEGNQDKAIELLDDLALNILYDESNKNADPFWEKTSADYFSGISLGLFEDATEDQININSISLMTTVGEDKFGGSTYIKEYFNTKDPTSAAYINASSTILAPSDTKGSIIAVFKQKIKLFASRVNLSEMLSHSDFSIADIGLKKTAVFIVIQDEKKTYHSLATILVKQIYETLIDVAQSHGGKLPIRTNFLLDEFANMPPLKDVTTMITAARSRAMRFTMIIQNFAQLNEVYGEQQAETIKGNCGNMVYLISTELKALEEISKMCGEVKSKKEDKTTSTPLVTISDLQKLKLFEVIIRRVRLSPFKTKLTPDYKMNWGRSYPKIDLYKVPYRERKEVKVFDVREYVKEKKKEKMLSLMNNGESGGMPNGLPMFGGMNFDNPSPFGGFNPSMLGNDLTPPPSISNTPAPENDFDDQGIDIDDIVKKNDARIMEIEKEEERLKNGEVNTPADSSPSVEEPRTESSSNGGGMAEIIDDDVKRQENNDRINNLINEIDETKNDKETSNDEFYDDFFDGDE